MNELHVPEIKPLKIAVALAKDVLDTRETLKNVFSELNKTADGEISDMRWDEEVFFCEELTVTGEQTEWTDYFNYESPVSLIERISKIYKPDLIICVFWKLFGSNSSQRNFETSSQLTVEQITAESKSFFYNKPKSESPFIKIFFSDKEKSSESIKENHKLCVQYFRVALYDKYGELWYTYKKNSSLQKLITEELLKLISNSSEPSELPSLLELKLPDGWLYLNKHLRENYDSLIDRINKEELEDFFDGKRPSLETALSKDVPRRLVVGQLQDQIREAAQNKRHRVTLMRGPGGEGKSTILLQLAVDLANSYNDNFHVIYRQNRNVVLKNSFIEYLLKYRSGEKDTSITFIIVSDDAHTIAKDVFESSKVIKWNYNAPNKIQFLLASQGTEWQWRKNSDSDWRREFGERSFVVRDVKRLEEDDAKAIVQAWEKADVLGSHLEENATPENYWKYFYDQATDAATRDENSNSFYGAILKVRKNQTLEGYVETILERLDQRPSLNGKSLKHYFAYIVALHADGFPLLRKKILQQGLNCSEEELFDKVLNPLGDEKVVWGEGEFVFARHDVVAAVAKRLYKKISRSFFHDIIASLAVAAERVHSKKPSEIPEIGAWRKMPKDYFFELKEYELALHVAEKVARALPDDPVAIGFWANLLRRNNEKEKAAKIFAELYRKETSDKGYFTEWGVSHGNIGNHCLDVWLTAIALSDYTVEREDRLEPPLLRLSSLGSAFSHLFKETTDFQSKSYDLNHSKIFKAAAEGAVGLGRDPKAKANAKPKYDFNKSLANLDKVLQQVGTGEVSHLTLNDSFQAVFKGISLAWELRNLENKKLPESLPAPSQLTFNELKAIFGIKTPIKNDTSHLNEPKSPNKQIAYRANKFPFFYDRDAGKICDAEGLGVDLSDTLLDVLKLFFEADGQGIKSQLTFTQIAEAYKKDLQDEDDEIEIARNFQRNLRDQLEKNYGLKKPDEIVKPWRENGYQLGNQWDFSKTRKYIDALARPTFPINDE